MLTEYKRKIKAPSTNLADALKDICEENDASFISVSTNTPIFETFYHMLK